MNHLSALPKYPLKYVASINDEVISEDTEPNFIMKYIDIGNVNETGKISGTSEIAFENAPSRARRVVRHGDVIISTVRTYLQAISPIIDPPDNLIVSTGFAVVRPKDEILLTEYCKYALRDPQFLHDVHARSTGINYPAINSTELREIRVHVPPLSQQRAIANYLDRKTAQIDELLAAKEELLTVLAQKRSALITHAVTRGLDETVPMRDSGVEWLGDIPAHWTVVSLKHLATIGNGSTPLRSNDSYWSEGNYPWLTSTVVNDDIVSQASQFVTEQALTECHLPIVPPQSVLVALTGEGKTRGMSAILLYEATINQHLAYVTPNNHQLSARYLHMFLSSQYQTLRNISDGAGSTRAALTCSQLAQFPVALPPISEQNRIVQALVSAVQNLDELVHSARQTIALLLERRTSLISAAVTGQIEVPVS